MGNEVEYSLDCIIMDLNNAIESYECKGYNAEELEDYESLMVCENAIERLREVRELVKKANSLVSEMLKDGIKVEG
jgi:hypothetical protein